MTEPTPTPTPTAQPTSSDPLSSRPTKRRALSPRSKQASHLNALFADPSKPIQLPSAASTRPNTPPPEIVANVQGSSAGAGSGEFHVYKASRRREYERLRVMDEEKEKEDLDEKFLAKRTEEMKRDAEKTERNRIKREKARARKEKGKSGPKDGKGEVAKENKFKPNVKVLEKQVGEETDAAKAEEQQSVGITFLDED